MQVLGVSISLAVPAQAFIVTQVGLPGGSRAGETTPETTENLAGLALITLGVILLVNAAQRLTGLIGTGAPPVRRFRLLVLETRAKGWRARRLAEASSADLDRLRG